MKKKILYIILIICLLTITILIVLQKKGSDSIKKINPVSFENENFDFKMINKANESNNENFMISPISIAYALEMLKQGASSNTKVQIEKALNNYSLPSIINIKDKISISNLLFINNDNKNDIKESFIKLLQEKYNSDLLFDDFTTADNINNWVSEKTFKMINKAVDNINPLTVLGLANTIAIDVEWKNQFECSNTKSKVFTLNDGTKMNTPMMSSKNDVIYIENDNAQGIIKDYKNYNIKTGEIQNDQNEDTISLQYIAILPKTNINDYLKGFNKDELNNLLSNKKEANENLDIKYSIPKYTFDYDFKNFKQSLINIGINDMFDQNLASFNNIKKDDINLNLYISDAIHKSHIELSESGTKASAVTIFLMRFNSIPVQKNETINIEFNRPFIFIIKEKNSDNIWFYGNVYKPMDFKDNKKCEENSN